MFGGGRWTAAASPPQLPTSPSYERHAEDVDRDAPQVEEEEQQAVDVAVYFRRYVKMKIPGFR